MDLQEGKEKFIQTWGTLGSCWGINRTMAQVHALLLVSVHPLSAQEIMDELGISRGNVNMNVRALIDWGLVRKILVTGERKEFFEAEKDLWEITRCIIVQRKKRELEPALKALNEMTSVEGTDEETEAFRKVVNDFRFFSLKADATLESISRADQSWIMASFVNNMIK